MVQEGYEFDIDDVNVLASFTMFVRFRISALE